MAGVAAFAARRGPARACRRVRKDRSLGYPPCLVVETRAISTKGFPRLRIYRPANAGPLPILFYFHSGGWVVGSIDSHGSITAALAVETPAAVVSVEYRRAPERVFPTAAIDCQDAVRWVFAKVEEIGGRKDAIFVGGDSAGANLATSVTPAMRGGDQAIRGQLLIYPCADADFGRPSR